MSAKSFACRLASAVLPSHVYDQWNRLKQSPLGMKICRGASWSFLEKAVSSGLMVVGGICVARILGQEGYGELSIIITSTLTLTACVNLGLNATAMKHIAQFRAADPERTGRIAVMVHAIVLLSGSLGAIGLCLSSTWVAANLLKIPSLAEALRLGSLLVLLLAIASVQLGTLTGLEAFKCLALTSLWVGMANLICLVGGCWLAGLYGAVGGLVVASGVACLLYFCAVNREMRAQGIALRFREWRRETQLLVSFSLPATLGPILIGATQWFAQAFLVQQPGGAAELAIYRIGLTWAAIAGYFSVPLTQATVPVLSSSERDVMAERGRIMVRAVGFVLLLAIPGGVLFLLFSGTILGLYGVSYESGGLAFCAAVLYGISECVHLMLYSFCMAFCNLWMRLVATICWGCVVLTAAFHLVPRCGALGLAFSMFLGSAVLIVLELTMLTYTLRRMPGSVPTEDRAV